MLKVGKGLFAENKNEAEWYNVAEGCKQSIEVLKNSNIKATNDMKLSPRVIAQKFKEGAKRQLEANKLNLMVQKEILKLANSKIKFLDDKDKK